MFADVPQSSLSRLPEDHVTRGSGLIGIVCLNATILKRVEQYLSNKRYNKKNTSIVLWGQFKSFARL